MAGTVEAADETSLTLRNIAGDTTLRLILDEETSFDGGELVEGNAAEVRYRASRRGDELHALEVTADETYPDVMGLWATDARAELPVELELLPRGALRQSLPPSLLRFDSWYVDAASGVDGRICITGEVVIEADSVERYPFTVGASLTGDKHGDMLLVDGASARRYACAASSGRTVPQQPVRRRPHPVGGCGLRYRMACRVTPP